MRWSLRWVTTSSVKPAFPNCAPSVAAHRPVLADVKSLHDRHQAVASGFTVFRL